MSANPELDNIVDPNFRFVINLRNAIRQHITEMPGIRVLNYGAGTRRMPLGLFGGLFRDQAIVTAYDPAVIPYTFQEKGYSRFSRWVNEEPKGQQFDLVGCSYSLHHMEDKPTEVVRKLTQYNPALFVIVEYDYKRGSTLDEFRDTFKAEPELRELHETFAGDIEACHRFHSQLGTQDYQQALIDNGFTLAQTQTGKDIARFRFFTIGVKANTAF